MSKAKEKKKKLRFSRKPQTEFFDVENEDGIPTRYSCREMTGAQHTAFTTDMLDKMEVDPKTGDVTGFKSMDGVVAALITRTVYDDSGNPVTAEWVDSCPFSMLSELHALAQELSGLDIGATDAAKND